ncbi:MAG: ABC transporter permease [Verrucomicrobiales bacterium]|nr:ABC transporter permease [Verrucomicrobiales bacterium]
MRRIWRIAQREYIAAVCSKGFLIGLILAPIMMGGGFIGVAILQRQRGPAENRIAIVDHTPHFAEAIRAAAETRNASESGGNKPGRTAYRIDIIAPPPADTEADARRLEWSDEIRAGRLHAFLEIGPDIVQARPGSGESRVLYFSKNPALDDARGWLAGVINERLRRLRLEAAGIDPRTVTNLFSWASLEPMNLAVRDARTGVAAAPKRANEAQAVGTPVVVLILSMMLMLMGATPMLQGVMEEKTQRIAEVLLGAATAWEILLGKLVGNTLVTLTALAFYMATALTSLSALAANASVPWPLVAWFCVFTVLGLVMYGSFAAALGSACNDARDAQQLQLPILLPLIVPSFLMFPIIKEPTGTMATTLSFFPPFTPLVMLLRLASPGGIPAWQPWVGLLGVLAFVAASIWAASRVFRVGILSQGKLPKLRELLRWILHG